MIRAHTKGGETLTFDLLELNDLDRWKLLENSEDFQRSLTALTIVVPPVNGSPGSQQTIAAPKRVRFRRFFADFADGQEEIGVCADDFMIRVRHYRSNGQPQPYSGKITVDHIGRRVR